MAHDVGAVTCVTVSAWHRTGFSGYRALGADIYLFSSYKTYGPHQGIMVVRRELADRLVNQAHFFNADARYKRFTPAGPDHAQIAACRRHGGLCRRSLCASSWWRGCPGGTRTGGGRDAARARGQGARPASGLSWQPQRRPHSWKQRSRCRCRACADGGAAYGKTGGGIAISLADHGVMAGAGISTRSGRSGRWGAIRMLVFYGSALCITPLTPKSSS